VRNGSSQTDLASLPGRLSGCEVGQEFELLLLNLHQLHPLDSLDFIQPGLEAGDFKLGVRVDLVVVLRVQPIAGSPAGSGSS
jgi:hypothetical protein